MFEPGATVDADRSIGSDWRLSQPIQPIKTPQPTRLFEPSTIRGAILPSSASGRASPSFAKDGQNQNEKLT